MPTALLKQSKDFRFLTLRRCGCPFPEIASAADKADACEFLRLFEPRSSPPPHAADCNSPIARACPPPSANSIKHCDNKTRKVVQAAACRPKHKAHSCRRRRNQNRYLSVFMRSKSMRTSRQASLPSVVPTISITLPAATAPSVPHWRSDRSSHSPARNPAA